MEFCPDCGNMLQYELPYLGRLARFFCYACSYVCHIENQVKIKRRKRLVRKEIEPIVSQDDMQNAPTADGGILGMAPTVPFNHSSVFGYNGVASASAASAMSFSSAMYSSGGTIPYMVDSKGGPVIPQVGGSSSTVFSSYSQPPIFMNMTSTQLSLSGFGPSRPNVDLNSGFMIDGGNRDTTAARQFFFPGQGRTMEEHVRTMPQPSSSGVNGKRKELDSGWEPYSFSYKHPQHPWK